MYIIKIKNQFLYIIIIIYLLYIIIIYIIYYYYIEKKENKKEGNNEILFIPLAEIRGRKNLLFYRVFLISNQENRNITNQEKRNIDKKNYPHHMILSAVKSYVTKDKFIICILNLIAINESYKLNNYSLGTHKKKKKIINI